MKKLAKLSSIFVFMAMFLLGGLNVSAAKAYEGGDLNGDAIVNGMDFKIMQSFITGNYKFDENQFSSSDMDEDGIVNVYDAIWLKRKIQGEFNNPVNISDSSVMFHSVGSKHQLTADRAITSWTTDNKSVASVGSKGIVIAISYGTATITATADNGTTASCKVTVCPVLTISRDSYMFGDVNQTVQLTASSPVTWKSSAPGIASVSASGVVKSVGSGSAIITGTDEYGQSVSCTVFVNQKNYPLAEGTYTFNRYNSSNYLTVDGASQNNLANVCLRAKNFANGAQMFSVKKTGSGNYNLWTWTNSASVLDINNWNMYDNTYHEILGNQNIDICQYYSGYKNAQEFTFTRNWDGTYSIVSVGYDAVAVGSDSTSAGSNVQLVAYDSKSDKCKWNVKTMNTSLSKPYLKYGYIKGGEAACRSSASSSSQSKGSFVPGARVKIESESSTGWYKVTGTLKNGSSVTGYLSSSSIDFGVKKICAKRAVQVVYLSPSKQTGNLYSYGGTNEAAQMRRVAAAAKKVLEANGIKVIVASQDTALSDRTYEAYDKNAVAYVAIHSNASGSSSSVKGHGTLGFYYGEMEGSYDLAKYVYDYVAELTPNADNGMLDGESWGFYEILNTDMANTLVEVEFHDNATDAKWIVNNTDKLGAYVSNGILKYLYSIT